MIRFQAGDSLLVATHNKGKLAEIEGLLQPYGIRIMSSAQLGLEEPAETEDSFVGNARIKAHYAAQASGLPALADDSGISVEALDGAPGVYTADWAETGAGRDFHRAMGKTWALAIASGRPQPFRAKFHSTLVLAMPDGRDVVFDGAVAGVLVWPLRGADGHGYDPMFQPDGHEITFAEMDPAEKNRISHRAVAFSKFIEECFT